MPGRRGVNAGTCCLLMQKRTVSVRALGQTLNGKRETHATNKNGLVIRHGVVSSGL